MANSKQENGWHPWKVSKVKEHELERLLNVMDASGYEPRFFLQTHIVDPIIVISRKKENGIHLEKA